ncbi:hypothetical protein F7734_50855 [Scytonema sp. UIC 10036]|uniref:hypothetical protein n=1 Tax=Scytonema sp. UIC 10036 TaxID=2304196 RepID=UPI0012DA65D4|nr:hypothetical protein [Scytonema sp. UIC 10036]MUH00138.1 hypothetical protein [Scytonema sp. UIC 10036]
MLHSNLEKIKKLRIEIESLVKEVDKLKTQVSETKVSNIKVINSNITDLQQKNQEIKIKTSETLKLVDAVKVLNLEHGQKQYISYANDFVKETNKFVSILEKYTNALQKLPEIRHKLKELTNYISPSNNQAYTLCQEIHALTQKSRHANKNWIPDFKKQSPELLDALNTLLEICGYSRI